MLGTTGDAQESRTTARPERAPDSTAATTLRRKLMVLAFATTVPLLAFVAAVVAWSSYEYRKAARQGLERTAQALSLAVDEQVVTWIAALTALSTSPALDQGDYATFRRQAESVTERVGGWLALSLPSGQQVVNTSRPADVDLPVSDPAGLPPAVIIEGKTHVSDLFVGPATKRWTIAVTVPSVRRQGVTHALHLGLLPRDLVALLATQRPPAGWFVALVDGNGRVITRAPFAAARIGGTPPDWYLEAIAVQAGSGIFRGQTPSGVEMYGAFHRLRQAPWTLVLAGPSAEFERAWQLPLLALAAGGIAFVIAILVLLVVMGRRLSDPINVLAGAARAAVDGEALPHVPESGVREIRELGSAVMALSQKQVLLREVNHRIKNSLQLVSATLSLQGQAASDAATREHFDAAQAQIRAVARLHERLYRQDRYETVEAFALARAVCEDVAAISVGRARVRIETEGAAQIGVDAGGPFALILVELITNAVKHASGAGGAGMVEVRCRVAEEPMISVVVSDEGRGLPPGFDLRGQKGMGLRMALALATQIGGTLAALPLSHGAAFELRVPLAAAGGAPQ